MPSVLVVDDSPMDRTLITGLLKHDAEMQVHTASNGMDALAILEDVSPDVVVTDLQMPELDGLQLLTAIRIHYPKIPVILVTAHGSEDLAVRALEQGATSYVPKAQLAEKLRDTIHQVMTLSRQNQSYEELAASMEYAEFKFALTNDLGMMDRVVEMVQQIAVNVGATNFGGHVRIGMALEEAIRVCMLRGNLELTDEEIRQVHGRDFSTLPWLKEKCLSAPFVDRKLRVHTIISNEEVKFSVFHQGKPLPTQMIPAEQLGDIQETPSDRSLILMQAFMDDVEISPDGLAIHLRRRQLSDDSR